MRARLIQILLVFVSLNLSYGGSTAFADHGPKKMWKRQILPYFDAHETQKMGPFSINVLSHGEPRSISLAPKKDKNFDRYFKDKFNLAALVRTNNEYSYIRFNQKRKIDANTLLHGMSMSKTALSAAVGSLLCDGTIKSLDDPMGRYSKNLKSTPYADVSIRNVLQMNSGVSPLNDGGKKKSNRVAMGMGKYEGKASVIDAVRLFNKTLRKQGVQHNYHSVDPFALSVLVTDLTGESVSAVFHENVFKKFNDKGQIHWAADKKGYSVAQARLVMKPSDWSDFGQYILDEINSGSCIGQYFEDGRKRAVKTKRDKVKYGYQFWVYDVNGEKAITMTGHGGFFNVLSQDKNTVMTLFSIDENYKAGNLFKDLSKIAGKVIK